MNIQEQAAQYGITLLQAHRKLRARKALVERGFQREFGRRHKFDWSRHDDAHPDAVMAALDTGLLDTAKVLDALKAISK